MSVMKKTMLSSTIFLLLGCATSFCATSMNSGWNEHVGSYLGYTMGYNTIDFTVTIPGGDKSFQSHHAVSQELIGGYMKTPNFGVELSLIHI